MDFPLVNRDNLVNGILVGTENNLQEYVTSFENKYSLVPLGEETLHVNSYRNYIKTGERQVAAGLVIQKLDALYQASSSILEQVEVLESQNGVYPRVDWGTKQEELSSMFNETREGFVSYYNNGNKSDLQKTFIQVYHTSQH